jgi:hypothetical protein
MAFATVEDLATYMARDFSAAETATATQALDIATANIQRYTGQTITATPNQTVTLRPDTFHPTILLQRPVTNIDSVVEDGVTLTVNVDYYFTASGLLFRIDQNWGEKVVVQYDSGYAVIPDDIKGVCLSLAARIFGSSGQAVSSESLGLYQVQYDNSEMLTPAEKGILSRYSGVLLA